MSVYTVPMFPNTNINKYFTSSKYTIFVKFHTSMRTRLDNAAVLISAIKDNANLCL